MCTIDYDPASFYTTKSQKARKKHQCCECKRTIEVGERYQYTFGVWENYPATFKTCCYCMVAQDWLFNECNGFLHGGLEIEIEEHACEHRKMFLYRWLIGIREGWKRHGNRLQITGGNRTICEQNTKQYKRKVRPRY